MLKRLITYGIIFVIIMQSIFVFAINVDMKDERYYIEPVFGDDLDVHYGMTQDTATIVKKDYGDYKEIYEYYAWWQSTCKHVGHDEWREYKLYPDGRKEWQGDMICYNEEPEDTYNQGRHSWLMEGYQEQAVPPFPIYKAPTTDEDGYRWESKTCAYKSGFWGNLTSCGAVGWKKVIIPKLQAGQTPAPTSASPTPKPSASPTPSPDPRVYCRFKVTGVLEQGYKVTLSAEDSTSDYPIRWDETEWVIKPKSGGTTWGFGVKLGDGRLITVNENTDQSVLKGKSIDVVFMSQGQYSVKCTVYNSFGMSGSMSN